MSIVLFVGGPKDRVLSKFPDVPSSFTVDLPKPYELDAQGYPVRRGTYYRRGRIGVIGLYCYEDLSVTKALNRIAVEWAQQ